MAKRKPWESAARRTILGDKHEISTLEGYSFKPRKYGVRGAEEINGASVDTVHKLPPKILKKIGTLVGDREEGEKIELTVKSLMDVLEPDELQEAILALNGAGELPYELQSLILKHGIGEHNFTDDIEMESVTEVVDDKLVESILGYPDQAAEMIEVIQEHNRPLAEKTSSISETSPNGSTRKTTSEKSATTTQTDETQSD